MKHLNYAKHYEVRAAHLHRRADAALDFAAAILVGVALAMLLVAWWFS